MKQTDIRRLLGKISSDLALEKACDWLCEIRKDAEADDGVRDLRFNWEKMEQKLIGQLRDNLRPLSFLFDAWFLRKPDIELAKRKVFHRRFVDGLVVLAKARDHLRKAVKATEQVLARLKLKSHPDKTFIGWIRKGFDFLGYVFTRDGWRLSGRCKERWRVKIIQLYERGASLARIGLYWRNWVRWAGCRLGDSKKSHEGKEKAGSERNQLEARKLMESIKLNLVAYGPN